MSNFSHANQTKVHRPYNWVVADSAARGAIVPIAADQYKEVLQLDTGAIYTLMNHSPITWQQTGGAVASPATATSTGVIQLAGALGGTATSPQLADGAVTTSKIQDVVVTPAKLQANGTTPDATKVYHGDGSWKAPTGGGNTTVPKLPLDQVPLHATYGDDFTGTSLHSMWTRRNILASDEAYQQIDGSYLYTSMFGGSVDKYYYQTAPTGDFQIVVKFRILRGLSSEALFGPIIVDASGNGLIYSFWQVSRSNVWTVSTWSSIPSSPIFLELRTPSSLHESGAFPVWLAMRKVGTAYDVRFSVDGIQWSAYSPTTTQTFTPAFIGFARLNLATSPNWVAVDRFNVI